MRIEKDNSHSEAVLKIKHLKSLELIILYYVLSLKMIKSSIQKIKLSSLSYRYLVKHSMTNRNSVEMEVNLIQLLILPLRIV